MFIIQRKSPNSPRKTVQIIETERIGKKVRQKIIAYVGVITKPEDEAKIMLLAKEQMLNIIKQRSKENGKELKDEEAAQLTGRGRRKSSLLATPQPKEIENLNVANLEEEYRIIEGVDEIGGRAFDSLFDSILKIAKQNQILKDIVLSRMIYGHSKYKLCSTLASKFNKHYTEDQIYRMMDKVYPCIDKIKQLVFNKTKALLPEVNVILFDVTTLYCESVEADGLREFGFSKDGKFNNTQLVLALVTNELGLPIGYELFPGNCAEVKTLLSAIEKWNKIFNIQKVCFIGDRAMFSEDNLELIESYGHKYIIAAKLRAMSEEVQNKILDESSYQEVSFGEERGKVADFANISPITQISCYLDGSSGYRIRKEADMLIIEHKTEANTITPALEVLKEVQDELAKLRVCTKHCKCQILTSEEYKLVELNPELLKDVLLIVDSNLVYNGSTIKLSTLNQEQQGKLIEAGKRGVIANSLMSELFKDKYQSRKYLHVPVAIITKLFPNYQLNERRLCVSYKSSRARNDALKRERILERLQSKQGNISNVIRTPAKMYMNSHGEASLDELKIAEAERWDGIHGVITNIAEDEALTVLRRYSNLWRIEEAFRINKHNLQMRPIYHYKPERIHAHIALCYMAFAVLKLIQYRTQITQSRLSINEITAALLSIESSIYVDLESKVRYRMPGVMSDEANSLYKAFGVKRQKGMAPYKM